MEINHEISSKNSNFLTSNRFLNKSKLVESFPKNKTIVNNMFKKENNGGNEFLRENDLQICLNTDTKSTEISSSNNNYKNIRILSNGNSNFNKIKNDLKSFQSSRFRVDNKTFNQKVYQEKDIPIGKTTAEDEIKDRNNERTLDENKVKTLNFWDKNLLQTMKNNNKLNNDIKNNTDKKTSHPLSNSDNLMSNPDSDILKNQDLNTINQKNKIRESLNNLHFQKFSPYLRDFYKKVDQEQGSILLQNISLTKRSFNFDLLKNNYQKNETNKPEEDGVVSSGFVQIGEKVGFKKNKTEEDEINDENIDDDQQLKDKYIKIDDPFLKINDLKLEGNYELLTSQEFYRSTVLEKIRVESIYRKEMMKLIKLIYENKGKKKYLTKNNSDMSGRLYQIKENYNLKREAYQLWIKEMERSHIKRMNTAKSSVLNLNDSNLSFEYTTSYSQHMVIKEKEVNELKEEYESLKQKFSLQITANNLNLKRIEEDIRDKKILLNNLMNDQSKYYLDILKKGIDSRSEGLCWVVRKLIELDAFYDIYSFPRFLEQSQIEFIITFANKQVELIQLKIILKIMKNKKNNMRSERDLYKKNNEFASSIKNESISIFAGLRGIFMKTPNSTVSNFYNDNDPIIKKSNSNLQSSSNGFETSFIHKMTKIMENIFQKSNKTMRDSFNQTVEDVKVKFLFIIRLKKLLKS